MKDLKKDKNGELVYKNNIRYAINYYLLGYNLVERDRKANYIITDLGLQWLEKFPYTAILRKNDINISDALAGKLSSNKKLLAQPFLKEILVEWNLYSEHIIDIAIEEDMRNRKNILKF